MAKINWCRSWSAVFGHINNKIIIGADKWNVYLCPITSGQMRARACGCCLEMSPSWVFTEVPKHHRPGERRPFGPGATHLHSCADTSSRCCSQANQRSHPKTAPQAGGPLRLPQTHILAWICVRCHGWLLSLNLTVAKAYPWGLNMAALVCRSPKLHCVNYSAGFLCRWQVFGLALTHNLNS